MRLVALGLEIVSRDCEHWVWSGEMMPMLAMPLNEIEANELAKDCVHYAESDDIPAEYMDKNGVSRRIDSALRRETPDELSALDAELLSAASTE